MADYAVPRDGGAGPINPTPPLSAPRQRGESDAEYADRLQREANDRAYQIQLEQRDYDRWLREATQSARQPYMDLAAQAAGGLSDWSAPAYTPADPFQAPDMATALNDPGYQHLLSEGQGEVERRASARGTIFSGGTLQDLQNFSQRAASDQYAKVYGNAQNAYSLAETLRGQAYDRNTAAASASAQLRNANASAMMQRYLGLANLAMPVGAYPGYGTGPGSGERTTLPVPPPVQGPSVEPFAPQAPGDESMLQPYYGGGSGKGQFGTLSSSTFGRAY